MKESYSEPPGAVAARSRSGGHQRRPGGGPTMPTCGHLWAIGYDDMGQAAQARKEITRLSERHCLILLDTAVAVRYPDGCVTLDGERFVPVTPRRGHTI